MRSRVLTGAIVAWCLLAAGCTDNLTTEVTRFHVLPPPGGESLRIVQADPGRERSPAFDDVARTIGNRLGALGYRLAGQGGPAEIVARLDYGVSPGPAFVADPEARAPAAIGADSRGGRAGRLDPGRGPGKPMFLHRLTLVLIRQSDASVLFEGTASSLGRRKEMEPVMPYLIDAMFKDFPGASGATTRITVDLAAGHKRPSESGK